jgi:hypothetical protein
MLAADYVFSAKKPEGGQIFYRKADLAVIPVYGPGLRCIL